MTQTTAIDVTKKLFSVRCAGCRRAAGYSENTSALRAKVYCSVWCYENPAVTAEEERNDTWRAMVDKGVKPVRVARLFGVDHALVYRTVARYRSS